VRLDGHLLRVGKAAEKSCERVAASERRRSPAEEDALEPRGERVPLEVELRQDGVDVDVVLRLAADDGNEVAVAAAVRAEGNVNVQVPSARQSHASHRFDESLRLRTARNASCGTSTP